jgi:hypothetical protein
MQKRLVLHEDRASVAVLFSLLQLSATIAFRIR